MLKRTKITMNNGEEKVMSYEDAQRIFDNDINDTINHYENIELYNDDDFVNDYNHRNLLARYINNAFALNNDGKVEIDDEILKELLHYFNTDSYFEMFHINMSDKTSNEYTYGICLYCESIFNGRLYLTTCICDEHDDGYYSYDFDHIDQEEIPYNTLLDICTATDVEQVQKIMLNELKRQLYKNGIEHYA